MLGGPALIDAAATAHAVASLRAGAAAATDAGGSAAPFAAFVVTASASVNERMAPQLGVDAVLKMPLRKVDLLEAVARVRAALKAGSAAR